MKTLLLTLTIFVCCLSSGILTAQQLETTQTAPGSESVAKKTGDLSDFDVRRLKERISRIHEKDQQFRRYIGFKTIDDEKIAKLQKMEAKDLMLAMTQNKDEFSDEVKSLLQKLQLKNDKENMDEFFSIVKEYGYPSKQRLGVEEDHLFVLLLHPPVELGEIEAHTQSLCELLLPEVKEGRMEARLYATFVDNMRGKILRLPQVYGTNQQFERKTGKILPPQIEDLAAANQARREIGMPELKEGEYRIASKN